MLGFPWVWSPILDSLGVTYEMRFMRLKKKKRKVADGIMRGITAIISFSFLEIRAIIYEKSMYVNL